MNSSNVSTFSGIRLFVHPVERRHADPLEVRRHGFVGQQHELLDQPMRDVPLGGHDRLDRPCIVEHDLGLRQIEVDRSAPPAARVQDVEQLVHALEHRHERS